MTTISAAEVRSAEVLAAGPGPHLTTNARVCALIPHFNTGPYLADAIESLLEQTRPLDGIIVIDDCSDVVPAELLETYPSVTLLCSEENVGPYALIQRAIELTDFDAYLFQDADDWSAPERLELLLAEAIRTGAELIGSQGLRVIVDEGEIVTYLHSLNPNKQLEDVPTANPIHHPTSLVSRALVMRLGGFTTGLRFSGDTEFQRRAGYVATLANSAQFLYFYRTHAASLTGSDETGHHTEARQDVIDQLHDRAVENLSRFLAGMPPRLEPIAQSQPAALNHLAGPTLDQLRGNHHALDRVELEPAPNPIVPESTSATPVAIIGAPRSGVSLLAGCLAQHAAFQLIHDPEWLVSVANSTHSLFQRANSDRLISDLAILGIDEEAFAHHIGRSVADLLVTGEPAAVPLSEFDALFEEKRPQARSEALSRPRLLFASPALTFDAFALNRLFPDMQFIHIIRNPNDVATSLSGRNELLYRSHFEHMRHNQAIDQWTDHVQAASEVETAFGSDRVLRVERDKLIREPSLELERIASFLGEKATASMQRPLR